MTKPIRPELPIRPEPSPIVEEYFARYREFHRDGNAIEPLLPYDRGDDSPSVRLIGDLQPERHRWSDSHPEIRFSQAERLERLREIAEQRIAQIHERVQLAEQLVDYFECHEAEIRAYQESLNKWEAACRDLERAYNDALIEWRNDIERAEFTIGTLVREYRGRILWQIVARDGRGAVLREFDWYDGAKTRSKVVADVFPLERVGFREIASAA